jgi:hypothetical protein
MMLLAGVATAAVDYDTAPAVTAPTGYILAVTEHPGVCDVADETCVGTRAPVHEWSIRDGDRVALQPDALPSAVAAVVRTRRLYLPVTTSNAADDGAMIVTVKLATVPTLLIAHAGSSYTVEVTFGQWYELPELAGGHRLYARLSEPETPE